MNIEKIDEITKLKKSNDYFKFTEGKNKIRIVSDMIHITEHFKNDPNNKPNDKWACFIVHYENKKETLKLARFPYTITHQIDMLFKDPEWNWEGTIMPFTVTVNAKDAGTREVVYTSTPSPKLTDLSEEMTTQLAEKNIHETTQKLKEYRDKAMQEFSTPQGLPPVKADEINFSV